MEDYVDVRDGEDYTAGAHVYCGSNIYDGRITTHYTTSNMALLSLWSDAFNKSGGFSAEIRAIDGKLLNSNKGFSNIYLVADKSIVCYIYTPSKR